MFRILNLESRYYLGFRILILGFIAACLGFVAFIPNAEAAIVIQAPKYIGLNSGLVGYWSFDPVREKQIYQLLKKKMCVKIKVVFT